jgi:hypothetical protein
VSQLLPSFIHRSAWKGNSRNFALLEFYELRLLGRYSVSKKIEYPQFVHAA